MYDVVECPYCDYENDMSDGLIDLSNDNMFDHECINCEKEFEVYVEFSPSYSAGKIEYVNCEKCNDKTREPRIRGCVFPYPKSIEEDVVCDSCFWSGISQDYKIEEGNCYE